MSKLLRDWTPSEAAINLIKLNGISDEQIASAAEYLKSRQDLDSIDDIEGYDNWNTFFIMFCIKVSNSNGNG